MKRLLAQAVLRGKDRGAFAVVFAFVLVPLLGFMGLALDVAQVYARSFELQAIADSGAVAAARALDGTRAGAETAMAKAKAAAEANAFGFPAKNYAEWSPGALSLGPSAEGPWTLATEATDTQLESLFFARVDTRMLSAEHGRVGLLFMQIFSPALASSSTSAFSVAGRIDTLIAPLAVCALAPEIKGVRVHSASVAEEIEFGFRVGVSYNLLNLNPEGTTPVHYLVNPFDYGPVSKPAHSIDAAVRPFVCTGSMPTPYLGSGSRLHVREMFPTSMITELNSRFALFPTDTACNKLIAPPDKNVRDYRGWWFSPSSLTKPGSAKAFDPLGKVVTIAEASANDIATFKPDRHGNALSVTKGDYGPLWSFARPRRHDAASGITGAPFEYADWSTLYPVNDGGTPPSAASQPDPQPYAHPTLWKTNPPPSYKGLAGRRVLNVALLACPVVGTQASVLGIGRFLMITPGTLSPAGAVHAEFGGAVPYGAAQASAVGVYQ